MIKFIYKNGRLEMYDPDFKDNPNRVNPPDDDDLGDVCFEITHEMICEKLRDANFLWEAISLDGFVPPYSDSAKGFHEQRQNIIARQNLEAQIVNAVVEHDYKALGQIVYDQLTEYAEHCIDFREGR